MTRLRSVLGSLLFLVVAPGTVTVLLPWLITGWDAAVVTDKFFIQDYGLRTYFAVIDPFKSGGLETVAP